MFERRVSQPYGEAERLLERAAPLAEMCSVVDGSWPHRPGPIVIEGAPGLGKTALLNAISGWAATAGVRVVQLSCVDEDRHVPMGLLSRLLEDLPGGVDVLQRLDVSGESRRTGDLPLSGPEHQEWLGDLVRAVECATEGPLLLAIDNLHLADEESANCVQLLSRRVDSSRIHVIVTKYAQRASGPLSALDRLLVDPDTHVLSLTPLSLAAATELVERQSGVTLDAAAARVIQGATGGNPFLLVGLIRNLARMHEPSNPETLLAALESVPSVVCWVLQRISSLPPSAHSLLEAVAVLGPFADLRIAAAVAGVEAGEAGRLADELADVHVLRHGRPLDFVHPVVRSSIYADVPRERRSRLHEFAAQLLSAREDQIEEAARHLLRTEPRSNAWAATALVHAARIALAACDVPAATQFAERAMTESANQSPADLHLVLGELAAIRGDAAAVQRLRDATDQGCDSVALTTTGLRIVERLWDQPTRSGVKALLAEIPPEALEEEPCLALELRLMIAVADGTRLSEGERLGSIADDVGRAEATEGDLTRIARVVDVLGAAAESSNAGFEEFTRTVRSNLTADLVSRSRSRWECEAVLRALAGMIRTGLPADVDHLVEVVAKSADEDGRERPRLEATLLRTESLILQGRLHDANNLLATTVREPACSDPWNNLALVTGGVLAALLGDMPTAPHVLSLVAGSDWRQLGPLNDYRAAEECGRLQLHAGQWTAALAEFAQAADLAAAHGVVNPALTSWRLGRCRALVQLGEAAAASALAEENLAMAREFGAPLAIARALRCAAWTQLPEARPPMLEEAFHTLAGTGLDLDRCKTLLGLGKSLRLVGDAAGARQVLREAADIAVRIGAGSLATAAADNLRATGARPRTLHLRGSDSLTPSERRVVDLAAQGHTNSAIASSLFVSLKTVESHLLRAYRKLGIRTRAELRVLLNDDVEQFDVVLR